MNPCPEYAALLDLYADGELTAEETARVAEHLTRCPGCAAYVDDILTIRAAFPDVEDTPVPEDFSRRVMEAVAAHPRTTPQKRRPWLRAALPLAACLAVAILLQSGTLQRLIPAGAGSSSDTAAGAAMTENTTEAGWDGAADMADGGAAAEESASLPRLSDDADGAAPEETVPPEEAAEVTPEVTAEVTPEVTAEEAPEVTAEEAPEAAAEEAPGEAAEDVPAGEKDAAGPQLFTASAAAPDLTLTAREAGTLLEAYAPVSETDTQRLYQLTAPEYAALLTALDDAGIAWSGTAPDTAETFLVAVTP